MNLKQAKYIKTIAECRSITEAARKLYVSQPSLSKMLLQIEADIGLTLFDRSVSPFTITFAGEQYLAAAEKIIAANEQLENQLREIKKEHFGKLRLGISVQRAMQVMPLVIPIFQIRYPNVALELSEGGSANLEERLHRGDIDLAFAAIESTSASLTYELIEKETIGILAGRDSDIARRLTAGIPVTLKDAEADRFVSLTQGHSVRVVQDKLFRRYGFRPQMLLQTDSLEVGRRIVLETGSCMLMSNIYVDDYVRERGGAFFPLADYENNRHFYACYRKDDFLPSYGRDFIKITTEALAREKESPRRYRR
ncbi:MAG: LysR family transcriptional regulator [Ruminococcaceae bacterium]|nr:LysR family transcriptional regulator [Oscillospiraceae bacterium]